MLARLQYWRDPEMHRRVWQLAWPMILSNISVPLLGLVDTAVIGHLPDSHYLGAVAIGASIFSVLFWGFGFLRMATTGHTAKAYGADDTEHIQRLLGQSLVMALLLGLLLLLFKPWLIAIALTLMDPNPAVLTGATAYSEIRILSAPAVLANYALLGWFLGLQNTKIPLLLLLVANISNIALDILLVIGFDLKVPGVAWATVIADYLSCGLALTLAFQQLSKYSSQPPWKELLQIQHYRNLLHSNRQLFIRTLLLLFVFTFFTRQGAQLGNDILAANAVLLNFLMLISHGLDGFAHAIEALSGRYLGATDRSNLIRACRSAALWSLLTAIAMTIGFYLAGQALISQLTDIPAVINTANDYLPWLILMPLWAVWGYLLDGIFIGLQWFRAMQNCMLFSVLMIYLPIWWLTQPWANHGLWFSLSSLMLARAISAIALLSFNKNRLF